MKVDGNIGFDLQHAAANAREVEAAGYSGAWTAEMAHDPFLPLLLAAEHTSELELGTSIAVAFARNPMTMAHTAWDLQAYSAGGSCSASAARSSRTSPSVLDGVEQAGGADARVRAGDAGDLEHMADRREARVPRRVLHAHADDAVLHPDRADLDGFGPPKVFLAGVGELMTEVAGEVCDGFICHGFTTEKYLREVTLPALERGRAKAGKTMEGFEIVGPSFVVTGNDDDELKRAADGTRQQISFYGSTPAYKGVLDIHGWGDLQVQLNNMSKLGEWEEMGALIDDEILNTFAVVGEPEQIAPELTKRYGDVIQRISFYAPYQSDPDRWQAVMNALKAA